MTPDSRVYQECAVEETTTFAPRDICLLLAYCVGRRPRRRGTSSRPGASPFPLWMYAVMVLAVAVGCARGCSFFATAVPGVLTNLSYVNYFMRRRGPDGTRCLKVRSLTVCHNLLYMTGELVPQPFVDEADNIVAVYNGEIYNFEDMGRELGLGRLRSDGEVVVPMYTRYGAVFPRRLDGEFALVVFDIKRGLAVLAVDAFSTKPLWYSTHGGLRVASYRSGVERLGAPPRTVRMLDPNTVLVLRLGGSGAASPVVARFAVYEFDLRQFKTGTSDFIHAFERAVAKRARSVHPLFIGLSSGYDSGSIQVALRRQRLPHASYTIFSTEDIGTVEERTKWTGGLVEANIVVLSEADRFSEELFLRDHGEHFIFSGVGRLGSLFDDPASHGLSYICREVRIRGILVYLSGTGADEVISDYGHGGRKFFPHSNFGGLFPENLNTLFPWHSLFLGTQRDYLMKEELVAGAHGVEARFPFLDRAVVQEYLWLTAAVKNERYKAPLHGFLAGAGYPFRAGEKLGFNADHNLRPDGASLLIRAGAADAPWAAWSVADAQEEDALGADEAALLAEENRVNARAEQIEVREALLTAVQDEFGTDTLELETREAQLVMGIDASGNERIQRIQQMLHVMMPRLATMRRAASSYNISAPLVGMRSAGHDVAGIADSISPGGHPSVGAATPKPGISLRISPTRSRWSAVEVVTCVSGGVRAVVADFPVFKIFSATTPLHVNNVCDNVEWEGMHFRLRRYERFFRELRQRAEAPILYYVSDGLDVFFNDLREVAPSAAYEGAEDPAASYALHTTRVIIERYEAIANGVAGTSDASLRRPIVASTERLCGWGGARLCSDEEEQRYPMAPTDSKYLNAGGYLGPSEALSEMITTVLRMKENATGEEMEKARDSDQYFFKRYFWDHQGLIALDYNQSIFGNFLEVVNRRCENDWLPQCAVRPCCTESDNFRRFHKIFHGRYEVRGCAVWRQRNLPVSWHGNGAGKWLYLLALDGLSLQCAPVANLTLEQYPLESLKGIFDRFEERSAAERGVWPGGFLLRDPKAPVEAPSKEPPLDCFAEEVSAAAAVT